MQVGSRIFHPWLWHGITAVLIVLFFMGTRHFPLVGSPGFEAANLFVLVFAPWFTLVATLAPRLSYERNYLKIFSQQLVFVGLNCACYALLLALNSLEQQSCSAGAGWAPFFIISLPPLMLAVALGTLIASLVYKIAFRLLLLFLLGTSYCAWVIYSWWLNPGFRLLTHASLIMSSDLLEGGELTIPIIGFRTATFFIALGIFLGGFFFLTRHRFRTRSSKTFSSVLLIITVFVLAFILHRGSLLMVGKNREQLLSDYSLSLSKDGITVKANPKMLSYADAEAILNEALLYKKRINSRLGPVSDANINIFLHKNAKEKFDYTGAKHVHFANPKLREIHISGYEVPHNVLGHELAHIYVGEYANTLWGVPGSLGIIPNLALTEGLAMALTPELSVEDNLSLDEQARALFQAGLGTDLEALFSDNPLQFISNNVRSSYIFSGAFLQFILSKLSKEEQQVALQNIIRQGNIQAAFKNFDKAEAFKLFANHLLDPVMGFGIIWAKDNFTAHSILATDCRDSYSKEKIMFSTFLLNGQTEEAINTLRELPVKVRIDLLVVGMKNAIKENAFEQAMLLASAAEPMLLKEGDERVHSLWLDQVGLGIQLNNNQKAAELLMRIDERFLAPSLERRFLIMRELLLSPVLKDHEELIKLTNRALLDTSRFSEGSRLHFAYALGKSGVTNSPTQVLAHYLYARMLIHTHHYQEGLTVIKDLKKNLKGLPQAIIDENDKSLAGTLLALERFDEAKIAYEQILNKLLSPSERIAMQDALERVLLHQSSSK